MQFTPNNEIRRVEAKSDPLSSVPTTSTTAPSPGGLFDDDSDDSSNRPPSTSSSSSSSGESTSKGAESSKCKFCDRVDELIKSSKIDKTETNEIKKMKESYTKLKLAIKKNLDKDDNDESQSQKTGNESDDDLVKLSIAQRKKLQDKKTKDSEKTKEVKKLTELFKKAVEVVIEKLQDEKRIAREDEEEAKKKKKEREKKKEEEEEWQNALEEEEEEEKKKKVAKEERNYGIELKDVSKINKVSSTAKNQPGGGKSRKKEIEKFIKYLSTFVKEDLKQIINGKHHEEHRRKHMEKLKSTDNGKNNGGFTDSMLKALVKAIGKDSDGAKEARKHLQMLLKEYPDKVPTALINIVRDKLKTKGLGIILAIQLSATIIGLLISIIPIPGLALIGEAVAIAANMGTDVITAFGPLNIIDLLKNGSKEALETFTKSMVPVINSLSGAWCCNKSDGTENKSVKLFLNGLAEVSKILNNSDDAAKKEEEINKVIADLQKEIESGSSQEKGKEDKKEKTKGGGKRRKTRKKKKRKRKKRKTRRRRKKKKRKTNKYRKRFTRRY
jgi:hypothetical protein